MPAHAKRLLWLILGVAAAFAAKAADPAHDAPVYGYEIVNAYPHDVGAFTQGIFYDNGVLYEGTGRYGTSGIRVVELNTGKVQRAVELPAPFFGEGIALLDGKIFQLTWREHKGFIYERGTLKQLGEFNYDGEGWGLTTDGRSLIVSDGTSRLRFLDPQTFRVRRTLDVREGGKPVEHLNELEFVKGEIYANVWQRDLVARIDPQTGAVRSWIDLGGLLKIDNADALLNGIAYDAKGDRLFVTGKLWPKLFEIRLLEIDRD